MRNQKVVKFIKVQNRVFSSNPEENLLTIVLTDGRAYKRQWYMVNNKKRFIYGKAWYEFTINENMYAENVTFKAPYKVSMMEIENIQFAENYNNPFFGLDIELPESTEETTTEEIVVEEPVMVVEEQDYTKPVHHKEYETIRCCVENNIPVYLAGPAGSGKNHTLEQIANELGMSFYFSNSIQQEYKLTGFIDAGGKYHETEFYKAATDEKECIFFLDEMDASIPEVLVLLNAAIANGYFEFPTGKLNLKHIHFVAAGNTVGSGADDKYTGRMVLDQATLDRFAIIEFDYDLNIEMSLAKGDTELVSFIRDLRAEADRNQIRTTFSYRCIMMVRKMADAGMDLEKIMVIAVMKGLDKDTIRTIRPQGYSKYHKALQAIQAA